MFISQHKVMLYIPVQNRPQMATRFIIIVLDPEGFGAIESIFHSVGNHPYTSKRSEAELDWSLKAPTYPSPTCQGGHDGGGTGSFVPLFLLLSRGIYTGNIPSSRKNLEATLHDVLMSLPCALGQCVTSLCKIPNTGLALFLILQSESCLFTTFLKRDIITISPTAQKWSSHPYVPYLSGPCSLDPNQYWCFRYTPLSIFRYIVVPPKYSCNLIAISEAFDKNCLQSWHPLPAPKESTDTGVHA